jgi:hypothetical protein
MPSISALQRQRQEECKFRVRMSLNLLHGETLSPKKEHNKGLGLSDKVVA